MTNETPEKVWRRFCLFGLLLLAVLGILDRTAYKARIQDEKNFAVLESLDANKILADELNLLFHGVQDDFHFFEREIQSNANAQSLIRFLETHPGYFMVRVTDSKGKEVFKLIPHNKSFVQSSTLFDLSGEAFYKELNSVKGTDFFFSSMQPLTINGVMQTPLVPTVRISKRVTLKNGEPGLMIFNIDGERILNLFTKEDKALVDGVGSYIASYPKLEKSQYLLNRHLLDLDSFKRLQLSNDTQGAVATKDGLLVFSKIALPQTTEKWFLIQKVPASSWEKIVYKKRMTWIFWGLLCFMILMMWYWKHEKKRYKDEVVEVLLKERNEFIQNVSHQLKTPLAILHNSLNKRSPSQLDWDDFRMEIRHLIKVVDDMLLLALVDANPQIPLEQEDILEIVSDTIVTVGPKSKEKNVTIRLNVDEKLYNSTDALERPVMGDLLKSALLNLLDNAIDFSPRDGVVDIFVSTYGASLRIQIKDNGPGIAEELLPNLFERFARGKTTDRKGTGLGLSITKKIVELHKGEIKVTEFKNGATFEITI